MIYLDYAAATPMSDSALQAMQPYYSEKFFNASGLSLGSKDIKKAIQNYRLLCAETLNTSHNNIIFTAGATEANALVLHGVASRNPGSHFLVSATEHDAILATLPWLNKWFDIEYELVEVKPNGDLDVQDFESKLQDSTALVSVMHVNNETGVIQSLKDVKRVLASAKSTAMFHTDASQSPTTIPLHFDRLGVDALTLNGGKIYGPKQTGALVSTRLNNIDPLIIGGGQEKNLRAGTESTANIAGFSIAFNEAQQKSEVEHKRLLALQQFFEVKLQKLGAAINGEKAERTPTISSATFKGVDAETLIFQLETKDIIAASGSACSARKDGASHVLTAMGVNKENALSSVRFSYGKTTTKSQLETVIQALSELLD